jgi:hypothetical protein
MAAPKSGSTVQSIDSPEALSSKFACNIQPQNSNFGLKGHKPISRGPKRIKVTVVLIPFSLRSKTELTGVHRDFF